MNFLEKLDLISSRNNSLLCIGLDSDFEKLPKIVKTKRNPQFYFNKEIIKNTYSQVCAYKINTAFYEAQGAKGIIDLKKTCDYLNSKFSSIPIIIDAKRADIGNTNEGYVKFVFDYLKADAITIHPYLGQEAIRPFLDRKDNGCIILCKTSNSGSDEIQSLKVKNNEIYKIIAKRVSDKWNTNNNCLLVVGATYPKELKIIRKIVKNMVLLIPGIGEQGGDIEKTMKAGIRKDKKGLIISSSRSIIFASSKSNFAEMAHKKAIELNNAINQYR